MLLKDFKAFKAFSSSYGLAGQGFAGAYVHVFTVISPRFYGQLPLISPRFYGIKPLIYNCGLQSPPKL